MTLLNELNFALLALDSYNRGYDAGLELSGSAIGDAIIIPRQDVGIDDQKYAEWQAASFYALAYQTGSGEMVISYRGTDNIPVDMQTGWTTGVGLLTSQARLAAEFYYRVKEQYPDAAITLTGHSLGGGLAGFVSKLTGSAAYVFDNMPFELAAQSAYEVAMRSDVAIYALAAVYAAGNPLLIPLRVAELTAERQSYIDTFFDGVAPVAPTTPQSSWIQAWQMPGEILQASRLDQGTPVSDVGVSSITQNLAAVPGIVDTMELHWMSALVAKMFSDEMASGKAISSAWEPHLLTEFFDAFYSDDIASAAGFGADAYATMQKVIAYSSLKDTGLVFGDTGIRAMFNDLAALGSLVGGSSTILEEVGAGLFESSDLWSELQPALVNAIVQFAAEMALRQIDDDNAPRALNGLLHFADNGTLKSGSQPLSEANGADVMHLDLSPGLWDLGKQSNAPKTTAPQSIAEWLIAAVANQFHNGDFETSTWVDSDEALAKLSELNLPAMFKSVDGDGNANRGWNDPFGVLQYLNGAAFLLDN